MEVRHAISCAKTFDLISRKWVEVETLSIGKNGKTQLLAVGFERRADGTKNELLDALQMKFVQQVGYLLLTSPPCGGGAEVQYF